MKSTAAVLLMTLALCAAASAQSAASKPKPSRPNKAAASGGSKSMTAAADDEVERLLDRYVLAQGGVGLAAVKTRIMRGGVDLSLSPVSGKFESYEKMPKKSLIVVNMPGGQFIEASDGGKRWIKSPWSVVSLAVAEDPLSNAGGLRGAGGFKWRSLFSSARVKGRAVVDGRETVVLAATPVGRGPVLMYFDAETGLLSKQEFVRLGGGKDEELQAIYIDGYATVDGLKAPALFRHVYPKFTMTFRVYEIKHNVPIDDALFTDPNGK